MIDNRDELRRAQDEAKHNGWKRRLGFSKRELLIKTKKHDKMSQKRGYTEKYLFLRSILNIFNGRGPSEERRILLRKKRKK